MTDDELRSMIAELAEDYERKRQRYEWCAIQNVAGMTEDERVESSKAYHLAAYEMNKARFALDKAKEVSK